MAFDPDAYIATKEPSTGFDPDAYLKSKETPAPAPLPRVATPTTAFDPDAYLHQKVSDLSKDGSFDPVAHAYQHPEDFETAFQVQQALDNRTAEEKASALGNAAITGKTYSGIWPAVKHFARGIARVPLHAAEQIKAAHPMLTDALPFGFAIPDRDAETLQAENTIAAQQGEVGTKGMMDSIGQFLEGQPGSARYNFFNPSQSAKLNLPKGDAAKVEALRQKEAAAGNTSPNAIGDARSLFAQRVKQYENETKLANGQPLDTGVIAGIYHAAGQQPSEEVGPDALKAAGAAPVDPDVIADLHGVGSPENLLLSAAPGIPGAGKVGGAIAEGAGRVAQLPAKLLDQIPKFSKAQKLATGAGAATLGYEAYQHPEAAAKMGLAIIGAKLLGKAGEFAEMQGREMRTGAPSQLTQNVATEAATHPDLPANATTAEFLKDQASRVFTKDKAAMAVGNAAATGASTAAGMAPINAAMSDGDPQKFAESEASAAGFGGALGAFARNRPMMVEAVRPFLRSEGVRALTEAGQGNDPLAAKSQAYLMSLPPEARDRALEAIGAIQGLPTNTPDGQVRAKLYVLNDADYKNVIAQKLGMQQAARGGGRGFYIGDDGATYVNGDYHSGLDPKELTHSIGHEFGGHAAINVMRAMGAKGGMLHQGLMDAARQALFVRQPDAQRPYGTPSPDFKRFVDAYNLRFDPTGQTQRIDWRNPEAIEEFLAEQSGQQFADRGAGELALPKSVQDRINDNLGRFLGAMVGVDTRKIGTETHFSREEVGQLSQAVEDTLRQVVGMKLREGAEIPEAAKELSQLQETGTPNPAAGAAPKAPSAPAIISPPEVTDALKALSVMGIKGPKANALIRMANAQHGSPINDSGQLAAGAFRIHGGGEVKPGEFAPKPQAPAEPVPVPQDATFRDELGATHKVTGAAPGAPRIGDIVATREGEIRRITRLAGDTVDTARPIDPLNARGTKTHKLADIQPLQHDYTEPGTSEPGTTPEPAKPALTVQAKGDGFIVVDAAGNQVGKTNFPTQRGAEQSIRQKGKGKFSLPPPIVDEQGNEVYDILDAITEHGGGGLNFEGIIPEEQEKALPRHIRTLLASSDPRNAPDAVATAIANGDPDRGVQPFGDGTAGTMYSEIMKAIEARRSARDQQAAEEKRQKAAQRNAPNEPEPESPTDTEGALDIPRQPETATAVSEGPTHTEEPAPLQASDVDAIAAQAEQTVTAARAGTKKKAHTAAKDITDAQVDAVASAHEASVPANYQGVKLRRDALGKETISGTFNPSRPFDAFLLKLADLSPKAVDILQDLQGKIGQAVTVNYGHAPTSEKGAKTASGRRSDQGASTAVARASGEAPTEDRDKTIIPTEFRFHKGSQESGPSVTFIGYSPEKLLSNFNHLAGALTEFGEPVPYRDIHDPHLVADMKGVARNHANGWKGDGSAKIEGFPDVNVPSADDGYKPYPIPKERFDFLNLILGDESAKTGVKGTSPTQKLKQGLAAKNNIAMSPEGEVNGLRQALNAAKGPVTGPDGKETTWSKATIENPLSEALRVDLVNEVKPELNNADESIRQHGYKGDIGRFFAEGSPDRTFTAAGFMPDTGAPKTAQEKARERIAAREDLPNSAKGRFMPREALGAEDAVEKLNSFDRNDPETWPADIGKGVEKPDPNDRSTWEWALSDKDKATMAADLKSKGTFDHSQFADKAAKEFQRLQGMAQARADSLKKQIDRSKYFFMPDDKSSPEEGVTPSGQGPSGSPQDRPLVGGTSPKDTGKPEEGETSAERLMREAEAAGLAPSLETIKGILKGDTQTMDKLRRMILDKTGRPARFMPGGTPQQRAQQRLQQSQSVPAPSDDRKRQDAKQAARERIAKAA